MSRITLLAAAAILLAGCTSTNDAPTSATPVVDLAKPYEWTFSATSCHEADLLMLVDKAQLARFLPSGFTPADGHRVAGLPAFPLANPSRGLLFANAFTCDASDLANSTLAEGQVAILVDTPNVQGGPTDAAALEFYELARVTPTAEELSSFGGLAWDAFAGNVTLQMSASGGSAAVEQSGVESVSFDITTPGSVDFTGVGRFWHETPTGLAWADYSIPNTAQTIGTVTCTIADGSMIAVVAGRTTCSPQDAAGGGFPSFDPTITLHYVPGLRVG